MIQYQLFYWDGIQTEDVYLYMLNYSMGFVFKDSVLAHHCMRTLSDILTCKDTRNLSVLYLSRITDTESLHAKPIEYFNFVNSVLVEMQYRQRTCNFTMLKYSMDFVYNDSVSVILHPWNWYWIIVYKTHRIF
jgi:hypothetical protein